eukprot:g3575.t1
MTSPIIMLLSRLAIRAARASSSAFSTARPGLVVGPESNVPAGVASKVGVNLHQQEKHPLNTIKTLIEASFPSFESVDNLHPVVTTQACFEELLIPKDHVSRSRSDTFYVTDDTVLRPHTSAHQTQLMRAGKRSFLVTGDVYRRDEVDSSHYPVFHQMEGVRIFGADDLPGGASSSSSSSSLSSSLGGARSAEATAFVEEDLKRSLEGMVANVFGDVEMRWVDAYFPFTDPSFELEIYFHGDWLEVLGCGVVQHRILDEAGLHDCNGWAFGLGLERLAMVLFGIPDIRLFWSQDPRFMSQFESGQVVAFQPYSKYPPCYKDITFWLPETYHANDLAAVVREVAGDLVEQIEVIDEFTHPKTLRDSHCYRITYRSMDQSLTNEHVDALQEQVRQQVASELGAELR